MDYQKYKIEKIPGTVYYIPQFITEEEERYIIEHVDSVPKPKWTQLSHRRLQNWGGVPHPKGMIAEKIPDWLKKYIDKIATLGIFETEKCPNHVLINEYLPGQGIMPHTDGPLFYPTVTTISCGSHTLLEFQPSKSEDCQGASVQDDASKGPTFSLLLEQRSLLILQDELYHNYLHSIAEVMDDHVTNNIANLHVCSGNYVLGEKLTRGRRVSLTIRHVPKTTKLKISVGK
ncbi:alpha-ketoglutarate-dependent dioxygenase alkB homolog 6 [Schistocerca americana]|uniref:alpha-ketoglutarate-dependent dioxygenase alkB homolog 6 n=1 Tax=Schistocerca americana TaxID=7009 RepID=UPI001F4F4B1C|nr:alpha-ketoglutarate-dependent dioxygenase alkB homolog 6 [Schistocerca americana]XP_047119708.1 alpha-ketoglutarate-dependent dioxygenase alkB homolog 6 [Schistocerca piceifrons]XP_049940588.1 alpha-ketoglutarate-dependent dioxygenase alkB homolog 6 [Schistocerca serialis cubense]